MQGSQIRASHLFGDPRVQDPYCLRCQPQVMGAALDLMRYAALTLERSAQDLYGYEIAKRLQRANQGEALFKEGTIYPVLRALAAAGLLTSRVVPSYAGPPRRYYRITDEGRAMLRQWSDIWRQTRGFVDRFIEGTDS